MFYDERIENTKGRIVRNSVIIAVVIALVMAGLRFINIMKNSSMEIMCGTLFLELCIAIGGIVYLAVGFIRMRCGDCDERATAEYNLFYNKTNKAILIGFACLYATLMPISKYTDTHNFAYAQSFDIILPLIAQIAGIYVVYAFRKNDIFFNYSIIEDESYYKAVFKNIGKYILCIIACACISVFTYVMIIIFKEHANIWITDTVPYLVKAYLKTIIFPSAFYLLCSYLERISYRNEGGISKASGILLAVTTGIFALWFLLSLAVNALPIPQATKVMLSVILSAANPYKAFILATALMYFGYEYLKTNKMKLFSCGYGITLVGAVVSPLLGCILKWITAFFIKEILSHEAQMINTLLSILNVASDCLILITSAVGIGIMLVSLIYSGAISRKNYIALPLCLLWMGADIYFGIQSNITVMINLRLAAQLIALIYICIVAWYMSKRHSQSNI